MLVVAQDGSGDFDTVQKAVDSIPAANTSRVVIFIKNGVYHEKVAVAKPYVSFVGESRDGVVIDWDDYGGTDGQSGNVGSTFASQTVGVTGNAFTASNLTIQNSRAPRSQYGTAVALSVKSDQAVFTNVKILGHQDTLYTGSGRQYYRDSYIEGDVDFIFGEAAAVVFDNSEIHSVGTSGYVTAAAQTKETDAGFVFLNSRLTKDASVTKVYLGRPWKNYAKTTFINTWMDSHIVADGWSIWSGKDNHERASYAEYNSTGPGANAQARVAWSKQLTAEEASKFTIPAIFNGWDPSQEVALPTAPPAAAPAAPVLLEDMTDHTAIAAGWAEKGATVQVKKADGTVLGSAIAADGTFQVIIPVQKGGTVLTISSTNSAGKSAEIQSTVRGTDSQPAVPVLLGTIVDTTTIVAGWAEKGATVQVKKADGTVLGSAVAVDGTFQVIIPAQKGGTALIIVSTNSAEKTAQVQSTVQETAAKPLAPVLLGAIVDTTTVVGGWAEKGSTVQVKKADGTVLGSAVAADGTFQVIIPAQEGGTILTVSSTNGAGKSAEMQSTVQETDHPMAPPVLLEAITDQTTIVAGWAEKGSTVQVKAADGTVLGSAIAADGTFQVIIPAQKSGTVLTISSRNSATKSVEMQSTVQGGSR
nr:pectinesterase family protein [Ectobacillus ponti]